MTRQMAWNSLDLDLNLLEYIQGLFSIVLAYILLHSFSLEKLRKLLLTVTKKRMQEEYSFDEAIRVWLAIRKSQKFLLLRVACMEQSLAFVIFSILKRKRVLWCIGAKLNPFEAHAWIEIGGEPFQEPDYLKRQFQKLFVT